MEAGLRVLLFLVGPRRTFTGDGRAGLLVRASVAVDM